MIPGALSGGEVEAAAVDVRVASCVHDQLVSRRSWRRSRDWRGRPAGRRVSAREAGRLGSRRPAAGRRAAGRRNRETSRACCQGSGSPKFACQLIPNLSVSASKTSPSICINAPVCVCCEAFLVVNASALVVAEPDEVTTHEIMPLIPALGLERNDWWTGQFAQPTRRLGRGTRACAPREQSFCSRNSRYGGAGSRGRKTRGLRRYSCSRLRFEVRR
jgi:hypothetical protein